MSGTAVPFKIGCTLLEGTVRLRSFDDAHLRHPVLRALIQKIDIDTHLLFLLFLTLYG